MIWKLYVGHTEPVGEGTVDDIVAVAEVDVVLDAMLVVVPGGLWVVELKLRVGVDMVPILVPEGYPCQINLALSSSGTPRTTFVIEPLGLQLLLGGLVCGVLR